MFSMYRLLSQACTHTHTLKHYKCIINKNWFKSLNNLKQLSALHWHSTQHSGRWLNTAYLLHISGVHPIVVGILLHLCCVVGQFHGSLATSGQQTAWLEIDLLQPVRKAGARGQCGVAVFVRESRELSLHQVSNRPRYQLHHLQAIKGNTLTRKAWGEKEHFQTFYS